MVFVKAPRAGKVKTRLSKGVGEGAAVRLYRQFVLDLLDLVGPGRADIVVHHDPPGADGEIRQWLGHGYAYRPQQGADLGERMANAFEAAFAEGGDRALLVGTDLPDLPSRHIEAADQALGAADAVLGPSGDGGYYLIGFTRNGYEPAVFQGIPWSTDAVFRITEKILIRSRRSLHILPEWQDVDTLADLHALLQRCKTTGAAVRTRRCLSRMGMTATPAIRA
jgi:hypothetical protein